MFVNNRSRACLFSVLLWHFGIDSHFDLHFDSCFDLHFDSKTAIDSHFDLYFDLHFDLHFDSKTRY